MLEEAAPAPTMTMLEEVAQGATMLEEAAPAATMAMLEPRMLRPFPR